MTPTCETCAPSSYSSGCNWDSCYPCAKGAYTPSTGATTCLTCAPGTTLRGPLTARSCGACPVDTYADGVSECKACPVGKSTFGLDSRTDESACYPADPDGCSESNQCGKGTHKTGTVAGSGGVVTCRKCFTGYYRNDCNVASQCISCPPNTYADAEGLPTCKDCPSGKGTFSFHNIKSINDCLSGGDTTCANQNKCEPGTYKVGTHYGNKVLCQACPPRSYTATCNDDTSCSTLDPSCKQREGKNCGAGRFWTKNDPTVSNDVCAPCPVGTYQGGCNSDTQCIQCAAGKYAAGTESTACFGCPPTAVGSVYEPRAAGSSSRDGAACCKDCFSAADSKDFFMKDCPLGTYNAYSWTDSASGILVSQPGAIPALRKSCILCPAGKSTAFTGATRVEDCVACQAGRVTAVSYAGSGPNICLGCPLGKYVTGGVTSAGTSMCATCPVGYYNDDTQSGSCRQCPEGRTWFTPGTDVNTGDGFDHSKWKGLLGENCVRCADRRGVALTWTIGNNFPKCEPCNDCAPCDTWVKTQCPPGTFSSTGYTSSCRTHCAPCPRNTYAPSWQTTTCTPCPAGKFTWLDKADEAPGTRTQTLSQCLSCPDGTYFSTTNLNVVYGQCALCPQGKYSLSIGLLDSDGVTCRDCPSGPAYQLKSPIVLVNKNSSPKHAMYYKKRLSLDVPEETVAATQGRFQHCCDYCYESLALSNGANTKKCGAYRHNPDSIDLGGGKTLYPAQGTAVVPFGFMACPSCELNKAPKSMLRWDGVAQRYWEYFDGTGNTKCEFCPAGHYPYVRLEAQFDGAILTSRCDSCMQGRYLPLHQAPVRDTRPWMNRRWNCLICPPGKTGRVPPGTSCKECAFGKTWTQWEWGATYTAAEKPPTCDVDCPSGKTSRTVWSVPDVATINPSTQYGDGNPPRCESCPAGRFSIGSQYVKYYTSKNAHATDPEAVRPFYCYQCPHTGSPQDGDMYKSTGFATNTATANAYQPTPTQDNKCCTDCLKPEEWLIGDKAILGKMCPPNTYRYSTAVDTDAVGSAERSTDAVMDSRDGRRAAARFDEMSVYAYFKNDRADAVAYMNLNGFSGLIPFPRTTCPGCPIGKYRNASAPLGLPCQSCPDGSAFPAAKLFQSDRNEADCEFCPEGKYRFNGDTVTMDPTTTVILRPDQCRTCPFGKYTHGNRADNNFDYDPDEDDDLPKIRKMRFRAASVCADCPLTTVSAWAGVANRDAHWQGKLKNCCGPENHPDHNKCWSARRNDVPCGTGTFNPRNDPMNAKVPPLRWWWLFTTGKPKVEDHHIGKSAIYLCDVCPVGRYTMRGTAANECKSCTAAALSEDGQRWARAVEKRIPAEFQSELDSHRAAIQLYPGMWAAVPTYTRDVQIIATRLYSAANDPVNKDAWDQTTERWKESYREYGEKFGSKGNAALMDVLLNFTNKVMLLSGNAAQCCYWCNGFRPGYIKQQLAEVYPCSETLSGLGGCEVKMVKKSDIIGWIYPCPGGIASSWIPGCEKVPIMKGFRPFGWGREYLPADDNKWYERECELGTAQFARKLPNAEKTDQLRKTAMPQWRCPMCPRGRHGTDSHNGDGVDPWCTDCPIGYIGRYEDTHVVKANGPGDNREFQVWNGLRMSCAMCPPGKIPAWWYRNRGTNKKIYEDYYVQGVQSGAASRAVVASITQSSLTSEFEDNTIGNAMDRAKENVKKGREVFAATTDDENDYIKEFETSYAFFIAAMNAEAVRLFQLNPVTIQDPVEFAKFVNAQYLRSKVTLPTPRFNGTRIPEIDPDGDWQCVNCPDGRFGYNCNKMCAQGYSCTGGDPGLKWSYYGTDDPRNYWDRVANKVKGELCKNFITEGLFSLLSLDCDEGYNNRATGFVTVSPCEKCPKPKRSVGPGNPCTWCPVDKYSRDGQNCESCDGILKKLDPRALYWCYVYRYLQDPAVEFVGNLGEWIGVGLGYSWFYIACFLAISTVYFVVIPACCKASKEAQEKMEREQNQQDTRHIVEQLDEITQDDQGPRSNAPLPDLERAPLLLPHARATGRRKKPREFRF